MLASCTDAPTSPPIVLGDDDAITIAGLAGHALLHYQPQLDLQSGAILCAEALMRWWHPRFGLLSPHASLSGTRWADEIGGLERWAAAEVCAQGARWSESGLPIQVALNVSTAYLLRGGFVDALRVELDRTGLGPQLLSIDVPFSAFAFDRYGTERVARALAAAGIGIVVDGVPGGIDLDGLADLGAESWKVDLGTGARRAELHASVERAVDQAHEAGALAVAKAVEDDAELAAVRAAGFDGVFGNVISPPLPADAARDAFRSAPVRLPPLFGTARRVSLPTG